MQKLTPILPCRSRDNASEPRSAAQAEELLAAWTALWHPALVAAAGTMPRACAAGAPPDDPAGHLLLVPPTAEPLLPDDWLSHAEESGGQIIRGPRRRPEMIAAALALLENPPAVEPELAADFLALGYCHYVVETISAGVRYTNILDDGRFEQEAVAAATAACAGDGEEARHRLQAAFDHLHTARDYYYASESSLLDLTLVAETTLGQSLRAQLAAAEGDRQPLNLLLSGRVLEQMAAREGATLEALRDALQRGAVSIVGGEYDEQELPLLPIEAVRGQLVHGLAVYERLLGARPVVFARRRFGMTPILPQVLDALGFTGAIHATLDDGRFPTARTCRQRWEGLDGTTIEAAMRVPIDAAQAEGFVRLPNLVSGATDMDNHPTAIFAHWPGRESGWYEDIRRALRYTTVLGSFRTLPDYFERTGMSGHQVMFQADEYRAPYLAQAAAAGEADPISRWARYFASRATADAAETMAALASIVSGTLRVPMEGGTRSVPDTLGETAGCELARALGATTRSGGQKNRNDLRAAGIVVLNPLSFSRRVCVDASELADGPEVGGAVLQAGEADGRKLAVVEVPPLGFAVVRPSKDAASPLPRRGLGLFRKRLPGPRPLAEMDTKQGAAVLRNEFFEAYIDRQTGSLRAVYDLRSRGPRVAQQVALRLESGEDDSAYSKMAADEVRVVQAGPIIGEVAVRGRLTNRAGHTLAGFRQTTRVNWGSRVIEIEIELDPQHELAADPWNSYYAARFAWGEDVSKLHRAVNQATVASDAARVESPQFVEIRGAAGRTTILSGGLPYHRRCGLRKLDTLLVVRGETARKFRLGIGIDLPQPQAAALEFLAPMIAAPADALPASGSGWLFHLDNRAVIATHWEPIVENAAVAGFRVRLLETEGRNASLGLRSFRPVTSAQKLGGADRAPVDLAVSGDTVTVPLRAYEWAEVEVR